VWIGWYLVPRGAHVSASKPVLVASVARTLRAAGMATLRVRLTTKGKALLKNAKRARKRVELTAKGTFTPRGGLKVTKLRTISLRP